MRKTLRNKKALSPVIASIILIAVTVAVAIAVAAWMGALTIGFMKTEELKIVGVEFIDKTTNTTKITVQNTGTSIAVIVKAKLDDRMFNVTTDAAVEEITLGPGESKTITALEAKWVAGTSYNVAVVTKAGNVFPYRATAPTA